MFGRRIIGALEFKSGSIDTVIDDLIGNNRGVMFTISKQWKLL